jgi:hypothetical protein
MNNDDQRLQETDLDRSTAGTTSEQAPRQARKPKVRRVLTKKKCRSILATAMLAPMIGLSVGLLASPAASAAQPTSNGHAAAPPGPAAFPTLGQAPPKVDHRTRSTPAWPSRVSP